MRIHEAYGQQVCDPGICSGAHVYKCANCGEEFQTSIETQVERWTKTYVSQWYPFCRAACAKEAELMGTLKRLASRVVYREKQYALMLVEREQQEVEHQKIVEDAANA